MINCRSDTMLEKASFRGPLERGQRCVVVMEGFYEWQTGKDGKKQPYFIQFKSEANKGKCCVKEGQTGDTGDKKRDTGNGESDTKDDRMHIGDKKSEAANDKRDICDKNSDYVDDRKDIRGGKSDTGDGNITDKKSCNVDDRKDIRDKKNEISDKPDTTTESAESPSEIRLVTMAGLYDIWKPPESMGPLYTYTIITVNSSSSINWLHERMPAILETDEEIRQWLDSGAVPKKEALNLIKPVDSLHWYPVSSIVNNVKNKSRDCMQEIDLTAVNNKKSASSNLMSFWLKKSPKKHERESANNGAPLEKKIKFES